jgi:hypothetical protein
LEVDPLFRLGKSLNQMIRDYLQTVAVNWIVRCCLAEAALSSA